MDYKSLRERTLRLISDLVAQQPNEFRPVDSLLDSTVRVLKGFKAGPVYGFLSKEAPKPAATSGVFTEQVAEAKGIISQPNAYTCQSACIEMAFGTNDVMGTRAKLEAIGEPGDPAVMGKLLRQRFGDRYIFDDNACLSEIRDWLKAGEFLITHGWFTASGHVICLDGVTIDQTTLGYKISVKDPWSEFDAPSWSYNKQVDRFDGDYSARLLYAAIVAGQSCQDASAIYRSGKMDSMHKGAWVHRILPAKK